MDTAAYLRRIQYHGAVAPTQSTLYAMQTAHLLTVPFENLDIHLRRPLSLKEDDLYLKIVTRRRGGFCYELNGLFAGLLRAVGFEVTLLSARCINADDSLTPEYDHLALLVQAPDDPDRYLADVGYGDFAIEPLSMAEAGWQLQADQAFKLDRSGEFWKVFRREHDGHIEPQYAFKLQAREYDEFAGMFNYHQTSPESSFTRRRICSLATLTGRITLSDLNFIVTDQHVKTERVLSGEDEYRSVLQDKFGIEL